MPPKKLKAGDPVLFYGRDLAVAEVADGLATVVDPAEVETANAARGKIKELREAQADVAGEEHARLAREIEEASRGASILKVKLRADLLDWWAERGVWVSDGRILSEEQREEGKALLGTRVLPSAERRVLKLLEEV